MNQAFLLMRGPSYFLNVFKIHQEVFDRDNSPGRGADRIVQCGKMFGKNIFYIVITNIKFSIFAFLNKQINQLIINQME